MTMNLWKAPCLRQTHEEIAQSTGKDGVRRADTVKRAIYFTFPYHFSGLGGLSSKYSTWLYNDAI